MPGTQDGAYKSRDTIISRFGSDYYRKMGRKGGSVCGTKKGFAANRKLAQMAGRKGGKNK